jgi:hypothetical protein
MVSSPAVCAWYARQVCGLGARRSKHRDIAVEHWVFVGWPPTGHAQYWQRLGPARLQLAKQAKNQDMSQVHFVVTTSTSNHQQLG